MKHTWRQKPIPDGKIAQQLQEQLHIDPALATILAQRGISTYEEAEHYFRPELSQTHSPFLMKNLEKAVERFNQAMKNNEKVMIYGDYDVDGTSSVSLFLNVIREHYSNVDFYIPDRFSEGYGLNLEAVKKIHQQGFTLLFTLDCGIRSVHEIATAIDLGIDVIVCDHHEPGEEIPNGFILDPKQADCPYPYKELCGCGVTFKFLQGVFEKNQWNPQILIENLDLVSLAIGADIVPITGENRILCAFGIRQINEQRSTVIDLMFRQAKKSYPVQLSDVVFTIAPRINAAGRLKHAHLIVELFTCKDLPEIQSRITEIDLLNTERKTLDRQIAVEAISQIENATNFHYSNVVYDEHWAKGVIGIVASKLVEKNNRPSIVLTKSNGVLSGSGRSIPQINIFNVLTRCSEHLEQFGGHDFACGMTLKEENLPAFKQAFEQEMEREFQHTDCTPYLDIDTEIDFKNIYHPTDTTDKLPRFARILQQMEPFGTANRHPVFLTKNVYISDYKILKGEHYRFEFQQRGLPIRISGIAFFFNEEFAPIEDAKPVDIVYSIGVNRWNGKETVQLEIKGIRPAERS